MGNCSCSERTIASTMKAKVPQSVNFAYEQLMFIYYSTFHRDISTYQDVTRLLTRNFVFEVKKLHVINEDGEVLNDFVYIKGINLSERADQNAMLIELHGSKVLVQYGHYSHIDQMLSFYRKRIIAQYRPAIKVTMERILNDLLSQEYLSSTKEIMKLIKSINN